MKPHRILVLGIALVLVACGGGGGGGSGSPVGGGSSPPPSDGGGGGDLPGGGDDVGNPPGEGDEGSETPDPAGTRAEILFPLTRSAAMSATVTIRGIAADPEGVANVMVNGMSATLAPTAAPSSKHLRDEKADLAEGEAEWSAEINLAAGENEVSVAVTDQTGEITENAARSTISYVEVPTTFDLDTANGRLVGRSFTLASSGYVGHLVQHNYLTGEQEVFDSLRGSPTGGCFRAAENRYFYVNARDVGVRELRRYDFNTRMDVALFDIPSAALDPGPGFAPWFYTEQLECDSDHPSAYLLLNYELEPVDGETAGGFAKSRVLEIPLDGSSVEILTETDTSAIEPRIATKIALTADTILAEQAVIRNPSPASPCQMVRVRS